MNNHALAAVAVVTPTFGPAVVTLFGVDIPILSLTLSMLGLLLARSIAPASRRKLSKFQEACLTTLLMLVLFLLVTGQFNPFGQGGPMPAGVAMVWAIGLGLSGLLCVEFFGAWVMDMLRRVLYGLVNAPKDPE